MTIYNFNLLVGYESTGVDYAQAYRARILRSVCRQKYIFTEVPQYRELEYYTKIGIVEEEILILPLWFVHAENLFPILSFEEVRDEINPDASEYELHENIRMNTLVRKTENEGIVFYLTEKGSVAMVEYYKKNFLLRRDHYSDRLLFSEYFRPASNSKVVFAKVARVDYYDEEGIPVLKEFRVKDRRYYCLRDHTILDTQQLLEKFMLENTFRSDDILLMDRIGEHFSMILKNRGAARIAFFLHSRLTFEDYSDTHHWRGVNYEYADMVRNASEIDAFLVSTEEQAEEMKDWFLREYDLRIRAFALPVGGMAKLSFPDEPRRKHSLVTVSRLDFRKRVDLLIRTAVEARRSIPDLTLDIYGKGPRRGDYEKLIRECGAEEYVRLMGYVNNFDRYTEYEGYISSSLWETFGLTLLEAMAGGLPLIGLDVPYGNRCFIHTGKNGYLIPYESGEDDDVTIGHLTEAVQELFTKADLDEFSRNSYNEAAGYTMQEIRGRWIAFLKEMGVYDSDRFSG